MWPVRLIIVFGWACAGAAAFLLLAAMDLRRMMRRLGGWNMSSVTIAWARWR